MLVTIIFFATWGLFSYCLVLKVRYHFRWAVEKCPPIKTHKSASGLFHAFGDFLNGNANLDSIERNNLLIIILPCWIEPLRQNPISKETEKAFRKRVIIWLVLTFLFLSIFALEIMFWQELRAYLK